MVSGSKIGHVMTLANSIIGVGILAMPFCFQKCGIILSILLLILSHFITRVCCHYLIKSSVLCRRRSFEYLGSYAFGASGKLMVELCIIGYLMGTCITYFVVVGDLGPQITAKIFNLNQTDTLRTWIMILVTILAIIPLGLLKNVDSLAVVCTASIGFYMCLVIKIIEVSGEHLSNGDWYENVEYWRPSGILQCLPIFSMALSCQMQLFEVHETIPNVTLEKMNEIVKLSTIICTLVYILVGFFGYIAFSSKPFSGNILVFLPPSITSDIIKIGFVISVAFSFPLVIFPCRASLYSLLYRRGYTDGAHYIPEIRFKLITIGIVAFTLFIGILIPSVELVIGLVGSTIGVAICIMFPAAVFNKVSKKDSTEKLLSQTLILFGFTLMILGTYANLNAIDEKKSSTMVLAENLQLDEIPLIIKNKQEEGEDDKLPLLELPLNVIIPDGNDQSAAIPKLQLNLSKIDLSSNIDKNEIPPNKQILKDKNIEPNKHETIVKEINLLPHSNDKSQQIDQNNNVDNVDAKKSIEINNSVDQKINIPIVDELKNDNHDNNINNNINNNNNENKVKNSDVIDKEAIQKEEQEIAIEEKSELKDNDKDDVRFKKTKEFIAEHIEDIKQEIEKQNKETQQLVLQRFEEIAEKVDKIERAQEEQQQDDENKSNLPKQNNNNHNNNKLGETNEITNNLNEIKQELKDTIKRTNNVDIIVNNEKDPIVKLLIDNSKLNNTKYDTNRNDEPLSYQIGEQLNSVINSKEKSPVNNNKLPHENTNEKRDDSKSLNVIEKLPSMEKKLVKNSVDESQINIEAVGRDILEIKIPLTQEKMETPKITNDDSIIDNNNNNNNNNNRRDKRNIENCNNNNENDNKENIKNNFIFLEHDEVNPIEKLKDDVSNNDDILPNIKFESTLIGRSLKYLNNNNNNEKKV